MKSSIIKWTAICILSVILVSLFQMPAMAYTEENICLNTEGGEYIIYLKNYQNEEFEFAFSDKSNEDEANLEFISSEKDSSKKSVNVAYISEPAYNKFFNDDMKSYIYVKNSAGEIVISGDVVDLNEMITPEILNHVSSTTKRIETKVDSETLVNKTEPISDTQLSLNTIRVADYIEIVPEDGATYQYYLVKVEEGTMENELFDIVEKKTDSNDMYDSLTTAYDFYDALKSVQQSSKVAWTDVKDNKIQEPIDSETGDKYIVLIKEENGEEITLDAKFMVCAEHDEVKYKDDKDRTIKTIVKLPVTGETLALIIAFAVVIVAIVVTLFLRKKSNKESK